MFSIFKKVRGRKRLLSRLTVQRLTSLRSSQIWPMALSVCFIFTVTIGAFPAVTVEVKSTVAGGGAWGEFSTSNH